MLNLNIILGLLFVLSLILVLVLSSIDKRKKRILKTIPSVSFIIPCYNDADHIRKTIKSIYDITGKNSDVIIINDNSTDNSKKTLNLLWNKYRFRLINNSKNLGKSETLNRHAGLAKNDIIIFVDADVIVNKKSLFDALARLQDQKVGAVSCPYIPNNKGIFPLMQHIEYNMLSLVVGSYNIFSAISLWGGFIVIKKKAFIDAKKFSINAIIEDMDLAFKLNKKGWKVEQSFFPVSTHTPNTFKAWYKQKIRWSSGGLQCFITHYKIWIKNPLHIFFLASYCLFMFLAVLSLVKNIIFFDNVIKYFSFVSNTVSLLTSLKLTGLLYGAYIVKDFFWMIAFTFLSIPYVLPLISSFKRINLIFLVIPFSIIYIPMFTIVTTLGGINYLFRIKELRKKVKAW
ncbi:MAG: glycosyltransferase family 2 protein [Candidatus Woesearchaeota archaeon]|jgi:biofilm PGA synthesis N-glycosyltransferase PgaC